jgi:hypothetical protein
MNSENDDELIEDYDEKEKNTEEEDSQTTLEIYLQIDLIKGVLTDEIISRIECGLRGIFLVKMYKELKLKDTDSFKLSKHRPLIDINNMEEEIKRTKEEALNDDSHKTADGESSKGKTLSTNTSVEEHDDSEYNDEDNWVNFNFNNLTFDYPLFVTGNILLDSRLTASEVNILQNGPNVGGTLLKNGSYNIPILVRFTC